MVISVMMRIYNMGYRLVGNPPHGGGDVPADFGGTARIDQDRPLVGQE